VGEGITWEAFKEKQRQAEESAVKQGGKGYSTERFNRLVGEFALKEGKLLSYKAGEYSDGVDRIQNFREMAAIMGCTPAEVALMYMLKHVQAVTHQIKHKKYVWAWEGPQGEGLKQRMADIRNYVLLLAACIDEEAEQCQS